VAHAGIPAKPRDSNANDDDRNYRRHSNDCHQNYHCTSYTHGNIRLTDKCKL